MVLRIREILLAADPGIEESIKWQAPTFSYNGNLASFYPKSKKHASLMFHLGAKIPGTHRRLEGSGQTSRVMKIATVAEANKGRRESRSSSVRGVTGGRRSNPRARPIWWDDATHEKA